DHLPAHLDRGFLVDVGAGLENRLGHVLLREHALDDAGPVAHLEEVELAARPLSVEPPAQERFPPFVRRDLVDVRLLFHEGAQCSTTPRCLHCWLQSKSPAGRRGRSAPPAARRRGAGSARSPRASPATTSRRRSTRSSTPSRARSGCPCATAAARR